MRRKPVANHPISCLAVLVLARVTHAAFKTTLQTSSHRRFGASPHRSRIRCFNAAACRVTIYPVPAFSELFCQTFTASDKAIPGDARLLYAPQILMSCAPVTETAARGNSVCSSLLKRVFRRFCLPDDTHGFAEYFSASGAGARCRRGSLAARHLHAPTDAHAGGAERLQLHLTIVRR